MSRPLIRPAALLAAALLLAPPAFVEAAAPKPALEHAELVDRASAASRGLQHIERLPDGRVRLSVPMQDLEAVVGVQGNTLRSVDEAGNAAFGWAVQGVGRASSLVPPLPMGHVAIDGDVVAVHRPGLVEEFRVDADGLRQDFIVSTRPQGDGALVLDLAARDAVLSMLPGADGQAVALRLADGRELHYHQLYVTDADGVPLAARMAVTAAGALRIAVDDASARYPVRIDPTFSDADWTALDGVGFNGLVSAMALDGGNLYVGGNFTVANGGINASRVAMWNGSAWSPLGGGVSSLGAASVQALAWDADANRLFVGGTFNNAGGVATIGVAAWDGAQWSALDGGMNGIVNALAWDASAGVLYAGGSFTAAGGSPALRVAAWSRATNDWVALGDGVDNTVNALTVTLAANGTDREVYVGGSFLNAGGSAAARIAMWNGSAWSALGSGTSSAVRAFAWDAANRRLYVGGQFATAGGVTVGALGLWDGATWSALGTGMNSAVLALAWDSANARLLAGGGFTTAGGVSAARVAAWDGSAWSALGSGMESSVLVLALDSASGRLFAGGTFTVAGGNAGSVVAAWDGSAWSKLGSGMTGGVLDVVWDSARSRLYIGGDFLTAGNVAARRVAMWNGSAWSGLGTGINGSVFALALDPATGGLYAAGQFAQAGGLTANNVAYWDGSAWSTLGTGLAAAALAAVWDTNTQSLYVGGIFTQAGGQAIRSIARWQPSTSTWSALGGDVGNVTALAVDPATGRLFVGAFVDGVSSPNVAAWNGSAWEALGAGLDSAPSALLWDASRSRLYAGGFFQSSGSTALSNVAMWDGSAWLALGDGVDGGVSALAHDPVRDRLFVGGSFQNAGGAPAIRLALWDGVAWSPLGGGANNFVWGLAWDDAGRRLYVGGDFTRVGGQVGHIAQLQFGAPQTITFATPGAQAFGTTPTLSASASSGLAVTFASATTGVCTVTAGGVLAFVATGTCSIRAEQGGGSGFDSAPAVTQSFSVNASLPGAPRTPAAFALDTEAVVFFAVPLSNGGASITSYTVTSSPGGVTATGPATGILVSGLTNGVAYTFTVTATNSVGTGPASPPSEAVTPRASQSITFPNPGPLSFGTTPTLSATASSGLPVTFTSGTTDVCTVTPEGTLAFAATGTCSIRADQAGNASFLPAGTVTRALTVNAVAPGAPTIGSATAGDAQATVAFTAPASNGGAAITGFTVTSTPGGFTANGAASPITVTGLTNGTAYTFTVAATNSAGTGAASAPSNAVTPAAVLAPQTITFANPGAQRFGTTPTLSATASSGLVVTFTSGTTDVCTITSDGALGFVASGTCTINADQAGNTAFDPAPTVTQSFSVDPIAPGAPTIGTATAGDSQATVAFTAPASNGGAAITGYTVTSNPGGFTANGAASPITVTGLTNGTAYTFTVAATNSAGTGAASAPSNAVTPAAVLAPQTITFANPGAQRFGTTPTLSATASSGLVVTFTSGTTDVCTITSDGALGFVASGTCTINADQAGDAAFLPAPTVTQSFSVDADVPGAPTIGTATAGDAQATVAFTAPASNGGAAITGFTVTSTPGGFTANGAASPITVTGLTNGTAYTFTVAATNSAGTGAASAPSDAVTPQAAFAVPALRPDRAVVRENSGEVAVDVLGNDRIDAALQAVGVLSIVDGPARGSAAVRGGGAAGLAGDAIVYTPAADTAGADALRYRVCFGGATPCVEARLFIDVRPLAVAAIEVRTPTERGFADRSFAGLRALPAATVEAHGLVAPSVLPLRLDEPGATGTPWGEGLTASAVRTLAAGANARDWRVLVDARATAGGDVDLYLGIDSNGNGRADGDELACASAASAAGERCDLALTAPANGSVRYWVLVHGAAPGTGAQIELFETPLDRPVLDRSLVATSPGALAAGAAFDARLVWDDPTLLPGQSRGGWLALASGANAPIGWVPVRIDRTAGEPTAFALQSGVDHGLALSPGSAHDRLFIDVPPGTTRLEASTASAGAIDLFLARVPAVGASAEVPTIAPAPARDAAFASARSAGGDERLVVDNPAPGRWYVTPVNGPVGGDAELIVRATLTGAAPRLRPGGYFNPLRPGTGLFIYPASDQWAALWFTSRQDGTPTWYYLQATQPGPDGGWRSPIYHSRWDGTRNRLTKIGEATVTTRATDAFTFSYTLDGETGSEAYANFSGDCPRLNGAPLDISGLWFDPRTAGSGYTVQGFPDYEFHLVFGYDGQGAARFLAAERGSLGGAVDTIDLEQLRGACPLCTHGGPPVRTRVGTLERTINGGTLRRFRVDATYVDGVPGTWRADDAVIPLGSLRGCAAN